MSDLTDNQARLLRFAETYAKDGNWTHLGEDARPDTLVLAELGHVEVSEDQTQYRLAGSEAPQILQELETLDVEVLLSNATIEGGWSVSDLKPATSYLRRDLGTECWELCVELMLEWDGSNYRDYSFDLYTKKGSDQLWENQEPICPLTATLEEVLTLLADRWYFDGCGIGC